MDKVENLTLRDVRKKALDDVYSKFELIAAMKAKGYLNKEREEEMLADVYREATRTYIKIGLLTAEEVLNQQRAAYQDYDLVEK